MAALGRAGPPSAPPSQQSGVASHSKLPDPRTATFPFGFELGDPLAAGFQLVLAGGVVAVVLSS